MVGTDGEAFHPNLDPQPFDAVFLKGEHQAAYSGFEGAPPTATALADWLRRHEITDVDVCGLATDYCVRATALDAVAQRLPRPGCSSAVRGRRGGHHGAALAEMTRGRGDRAMTGVPPLSELFAELAKTRADHPALVGAARTLTYGELHRAPTGSPTRCATSGSARTAGSPTWT